MRNLNFDFRSKIRKSGKPQHDNWLNFVLRKENRERRMDKNTNKRLKEVWQIQAWHWSIRSFLLPAAHTKVCSILVVLHVSFRFMFLPSFQVLLRYSRHKTRPAPPLRRQGLWSRRHPKTGTSVHHVRHGRDTLGQQVPLWKLQPLQRRNQSAHRHGRGPGTLRVGVRGSGAAPCRPARGRYSSDVKVRSSKE